MSESMPEYSSLDGLALGELVRRRVVSPPELLEAAIARAERLNPTLNAIIRRFYLNAIWALQGASRLLASFFEQYDVWLTPTCGTPPPEVGAVDFLAPGADVRDPIIQRFILGNVLYNLSGQPAISLPLHWNAAGLPIGTTFGARFGGEATLFQLASQLEAAAPWTARQPPLYT